MPVTLSADPSDSQYCWTATSASGRRYNAVSSEIYDKIYDEGFVEATAQKNEQIKKLERIHELTLSLSTQNELKLQELTLLLSERADDDGADEGHPDVCSICEKRFYKDKITVDGNHFHTNCKLEELKKDTDLLAIYRKCMEEIDKEFGPDMVKDDEPSVEDIGEVLPFIKNLTEQNKKLKKENKELKKEGNDTSSMIKSEKK